MMCASLYVSNTLLFIWTPIEYGRVTKRSSILVLVHYPWATLVDLIFSVIPLKENKMATLIDAALKKSVC
jgi:hypothetical protein